MPTRSSGSGTRASTPSPGRASTRARAAEELRGLLAVQEPDGLIPHVVFWKGDLVSRLQWHHLESRTTGRLPFHRTPHTTAQMQPPVLAQTVERVVDAGADGLLAEALPHLERYYRYLGAFRDPDGDGLISIVSQFESGLDFSPVYDAAIGLRRVTPAALLPPHAAAAAPEQAGELRHGDDLPPLPASPRGHARQRRVRPGPARAGTAGGARRARGDGALGLAGGRSRHGDASGALLGRRTSACSSTWPGRTSGARR